MLPRFPRCLSTHDLIVVQFANVLPAEPVYVRSTELADRLTRQSVNVLTADKPHGLASRRVYEVRHGANVLGRSDTSCQAASP